MNAPIDHAGQTYTQAFLPGERESRAKTSEALSEYFDFANRLLRFWLDADKDRGVSNSTISPIALRVVLSMSVKASKQLRSIIELCERGEAGDSSIIARSLFETALVVAFILKPRFFPREFDATGHVKRTIRVRGLTLSREFRATLYIAHHVLEEERCANRHRTRRGLMRYAKRMEHHALNDPSSQQVKREIGPEWTRILLRPPRTYSGLNLSNLARSLGYPWDRWYDVVYGSQSEHVHSVDVLHHLHIEDDVTRPNYFSPIDNVRKSLIAGVAMFYCVISNMNRHIKFGVIMSTALHAFHVEYNRLITADDHELKDHIP